VRLDELKSPPGASRGIKRVGRGMGSGHGKTSTRGHNGQKCRSGGGVRPGFEGGQMPLVRRIPKRGFANIFKKDYAIVNVKDLNVFKDGAIITPELLIDQGIIKKKNDGLKVLGDGDLGKKLIVKANKISKQAAQKIADQGGEIEVI